MRVCVSLCVCRTMTVKEFTLVAAIAVLTVVVIDGVYFAATMSTHGRELTLPGCNSDCMWAFSTDEPLDAIANLHGVDSKWFRDHGYSPAYAMGVTALVKQCGMQCTAETEEDVVRKMLDVWCSRMLRNCNFYTRIWPPFAEGVRKRLFEALIAHSLHKIGKAVDDLSIEADAFARELAFPDIHDLCATKRDDFAVGRVYYPKTATTNHLIWHLCSTCHSECTIRDVERTVVLATGELGFTSAARDAVATVGALFMNEKVFIEEGGIDAWLDRMVPISQTSAPPLSTGVSLGVSQ